MTSPRSELQVRVQWKMPRARLLGCSPRKSWLGNLPPFFDGGLGQFFGTILGQFWGKSWKWKWAKFPAMRTPEAITKAIRATATRGFVRFHQHFTLLHKEFSACDALSPNSGVKTSEPQDPQRTRFWSCCWSLSTFHPYPFQASNQSLFLWVKLVKSPMIHTDATHKPPDSSADDT